MNTSSGMNLNKTNQLETSGDRQVTSVLIEFVALLALLIGVVLVIRVDVIILENNLSEVSVTELMQSAFILVSAKLFAWRSWRNTNSRGYFIAVTTLFACMFVRENDALLDQIYHGSWKVPVAMIAGVGILKTCRNKDSLAQPLVRHFRERQTTFILIGLLLLVFSRLFGTGSFWESVMDAEYDPLVKTVVQEGLELLSYALIAYGSILPVFTGKQLPIKISETSDEFTLVPRR